MTETAHITKYFQRYARGGFVLREEMAVDGADAAKEMFEDLRAYREKEEEGEDDVRFRVECQTAAMCAGEHYSPIVPFMIRTGFTDEIVPFIGGKIFGWMYANEHSESGRVRPPFLAADVRKIREWVDTFASSTYAGTIVNTPEHREYFERARTILNQMLLVCRAIELEGMKLVEEVEEGLGFIRSEKKGKGKGRSGRRRGPLGTPRPLPR